MINKVWYCEWKMIDNELGRRLCISEEEIKDKSISIKKMVDGLLEYFIEEIRDDVIKKLDFEWEFILDNNDGMESCLYKFWYLVKGYLRRCKNGRNKNGIENLSNVCY